MAIQQIVNITLQLNGDGAATSFTYSFDQLFALYPDAGQIVNPGTLPSAVSIESVQFPVPTGGTASLDGFGNLVLNFPSAWTGIGNAVVELGFNSGTLAGTTSTFTSASPLNSTWTLPLNGATTLLATIVVSGTVTAGTLNFELSTDGVNWFPTQGSLASSFQWIAVAWVPANGNQALTFNTAGYSYFRFRLNPVVTGSGTITFVMQSVSAPVITSSVVGQPFGNYLHTTLDDAAGGNAVNTTVKGTQAARALGVQELKDAGRTSITFYVDQLTGVTSEALMTLQRVVGLVLGTAGTSYTVTAGKTLRLMSMAVTVRDTTTTLATSRIRVRGVPSGSVAANSPIIALVELPNLPGTAAAGVGTVEQFDFPDGIEIPSGAQIGISHIESTTSSTISVCLIGYEY